MYQKFFVIFLTKDLKLLYTKFHLHLRDPLNNTKGIHFPANVITRYPSAGQSVKRTITVNKKLKDTSCHAWV